MLLQADKSSDYPWLHEVNWCGFRMMLITGLPADCNTLDITQMKVDMIAMEWYNFSYSYVPREGSRQDGEGLVEFINRQYTKAYYDPSRGFCLQNRGFKYEQCTLMGFLDELPDIMEGFVRACKSYIMLEGRTAVIGIDLDEQQKKAFEVMPWLWIQKDDVPKMKQLHNDVQKEKFRNLWK